MGNRYAVQLDPAVVGAARGGDGQAVDELVRGCLPLVYNLVGHALQGQSDVDDVVQETVLAVVRGLPGLREPERFRSWLVAITVNEIRAAHNRRNGSAAAAGSLDDAPELADPAGDFADLTILRLGLSGQRRETARATAWLGPEERELLALWWLEVGGELDRGDVAAALGVPAAHAAVRVQRMKEQLDLARVLVRALSAAPRCTGLDAAAAGWDGRPSVLWRKRLARHVRDCPVCAAHTVGLVPADRLLVGLALMPLPVNLARWARTMPGSGPSGSGGAARSTARAAHRAARKGLALKPVAAATAAVLAVGGGVVAYAQASTETSPRTASAAASNSPAPASATTPTPAASPSAQARTAAAAVAALAQRLAVTRLQLPKAFRYEQGGYNGLAQWTRVSLAAAPGGTLRLAWPAADGVHVTPLTAQLARAGTDTVVAGSAEVGGLVAHNDGFALLTRVPDSNKWHDTAAVLVRYRGSTRVFTDRLTATASHDTSPVLDGQLAWNGSRYGAYFVVHGAGGFADGHYGDKLVYLGPSGAHLSGGWDWGCSHNEGIALAPAASSTFPSLCLDDWRSGLFVSTGIAAPDQAPVVAREQCWAGYCGGAFPGNTGSLVPAGSGRWATAFASRGAASATKNAADASGRGWTVTPRWSTHQVAVAFLRNATTPATPAKPVYLTTDPATDHVNVRIAPYGADRFLVSWESVAHASCKAGTCTGRFTGTHLLLIDRNGRRVGPDTVVQAHISGDIAVLRNGDLAWAFVAATPNYSGPLGSSPSTTVISLAHLRLIGH